MLSMPSIPPIPSRRYDESKMKSFPITGVRGGGERPKSMLSWAAIRANHSRRYTVAATATAATDTYSEIHKKQKPHRDGCRRVGAVEPRWQRLMKHLWASTHADTGGGAVCEILFCICICSCSCDCVWRWLRGDDLAELLVYLPLLPRFQRPHLVDTYVSLSFLWGVSVCRDNSGGYS